ncbi:hypothetical protein NL676_016309 [Syzygium grande]|nr:hypothetical protein NL676_016309 [Syzygium grande]
MAGEISVRIASHPARFVTGDTHFIIKAIFPLALFRGLSFDCIWVRVHVTEQDKEVSELKARQPDSTVNTRVPFSFSHSAANFKPSITARVSACSADCAFTSRANPPVNTPEASLHTPAIAPVEVPATKAPSTLILSEPKAGGIHLKFSSENGCIPLFPNEPDHFSHCLEVGFIRDRVGTSVLLFLGSFCTKGTSVR